MVKLSYEPFELIELISSLHQIAFWIVENPNNLKEIILKNVCCIVNGFLVSWSHVNHVNHHISCRRVGPRKCRVGAPVQYYCLLKIRNILVWDSYPQILPMYGFIFNICYSFFNVVRTNLWQLFGSRFVIPSQTIVWGNDTRSGALIQWTRV